MVHGFRDQAQGIELVVDAAKDTVSPYLSQVNSQKSITM
jgi:hypothetical protein